MTRKERLLKTLNGETVDRPAVSFYEIDGFTQSQEPDDPYNIYSDPSWAPLLDLAKEKADAISPASVNFMEDTQEGGNIFTFAPFCIPAEMLESDAHEEGDSLFYTHKVRANNRTLTATGCRNRDVNTYWTTEHLLKDADDLKAWLELPLPELRGKPDISKVFSLENKIGDAGIVRIETTDPIGLVASLFSMEDYTITAFSEPGLFRKALDKAAEYIYARAEKTAVALPGRLWRICGPEYASVPYLPPQLFEEYVTKYDKPLVEIIQKNGGFARIHSHGNLKDILDMVCATGCMGLDPVEPPPQGDVELSYVIEHYGEQLVLFGNLEASNLENLSPEQFREKIKRALNEGSGKGRGFVLMPSACPYGRKLGATAMKNYEQMIELTENF